MNKIVSLALLVGGIVLIINGFNATNSFKRDRFRQQPGLFDQVDDCQADQFERIHNGEVESTRSMCFPFSLNCAAAFFSAGTLALNVLWDVNGSRVRNPGNAFCANCTTGDTNFEQRARLRRAGSSRCPAPQTCK